MTDLELLELAAKAAGYESQGMEDGRMYLFGIQDGWNPLTDDGDALQLAVKLRMKIDLSDYGAAARIGTGRWYGYEEHIYGGIEAATRRAIVRAAAELGKAMTATPTSD